MDCMSLLTHIHGILNLWVDDERAILYDICRLQRMIQDHVLPGPITGIPLAFTNPKQSLLPDMTRLFLCLREHTRTHTEMLIWLINLFFLWLQKKKKTKTGSVSHMRGEEMTPRSVILERQSRVTLTFHFVEMPVDYSVNWGTRETDRRRKGKQNKLILRENRWHIQYMYINHAIRDSLHTIIILFILMSDGEQFWVAFKNIFIYAWIQYVCICWRDVGGVGGWGGVAGICRGLSESTPSLLAPLSLHCLSPLTCPMACRLQTGTS